MKHSKSLFENFSASEIDMKDVVTGGDLVPTEWVEEDGSGGGADHYSPSMNRVFYHEK